MPNDFTAFEIQKWSNITLPVLEELLVVGNLFNRDFESDFGERGEIVNTRRLGTFSGDRLEKGAQIQKQDATATNIQIELNQHAYDSFGLLDRDLSRAFKDLLNEYIEPSVRGVVEFVDLVAVCELYQYYKNQVGSLDDPVDYSTLVAANRTMSQLNNPKASRILAVGPSMEANFLETDKLTEARMTGDGSPIINGSIGRGSGFEIPMSQMLPELDSGHETRDGAIDEALGYNKGATTLTVDGITGAVTNGAFMKLAGNVYRIAGHTEDTGDTVEIVIESPGLYKAVEDNEPLYVYSAGAVDNAAGYAVGWTDWIVIDDGDTDTAFTTKFPQVGQGVAFGTDSNIYGVVKVDEGNSKIKVNRPLDAALSDNDAVNLFPDGAYGWAMRPGAATMAMRPMAPPRREFGIMAAATMSEGFGLRSMISYGHDYMDYTASIDTLFGIKKTDGAQGVVVLGRVE